MSKSLAALTNLVVSIACPLIAAAIFMWSWNGAVVGLFPQLPEQFHDLHYWQSFGLLYALRMLTLIVRHPYQEVTSEYIEKMSEAIKEGMKNASAKQVAGLPGVEPGTD